ncbi:MAG TPA: RsbRD N-terminal domain-containing protein, partial [Caldimonas sp.]|nr:RsbRD N-terminal domain-containing protein [Caldimonas sp.]
MKLSDFILRDMEVILAQWEAFARTMPLSSHMDSLALRDHAEQILVAICKDIDLAQSVEEQSRKSRGLAAPLDARETAAQTHALLRARGGFDINQMASEYRALRASVLSLWAAACGPGGTDLQQTIRFNGAIDQALCESIAFFSA